ncbi:hypothetical protein ACXR0O_25840 [Verrucomicrobiota bacterium sgz303538]
MNPASDAMPSCRKFARLDVTGVAGWTELADVTEADHGVLPISDEFAGNRNMELEIDAFEGLVWRGKKLRR